MKKLGAITWSLFGLQRPPMHINQALHFEQDGTASIIYDLTDLNETLIAVTMYTKFMTQVIKILVFTNRQQYIFSKTEHTHTHQ